MLWQVIYSSRATQPMAAADLAQILADARAGNEARDVTGVLIHADGVFVQVLEGEREVLDALLDNIRSDSRHRAMKVFHEAGIDERTFHEWRMAYLSPDPADMARWTGLEGTESIHGLLERLRRDTERVPRVLLHIVEAIAAEGGES